MYDPIYLLCLTFAVQTCRARCRRRRCASVSWRRSTCWLTSHATLPSRVADTEGDRIPPLFCRVFRSSHDTGSNIIYSNRYRGRWGKSYQWLLSTIETKNCAVNFVLNIISPCVEVIGCHSEINLFQPITTRTEEHAQGDWMS